MGREKYYSLTKIKKFADNHGCLYRLIIGQRSNGKTFGVLREGLTEYFKMGKKIAYIRRYKEDITKPNLETLFDPQLTYVQSQNKKIVDIDYYSRKFCFVYDDKTKSEPFCKTFSLSAWERQKGADTGEYSLILFDEFVTRDCYLGNETDILLDVISSIMRDREGVPVYMVANTVSQHCPYFDAFGFKIADIKQGELKQISPLACIEYCNSTGKQSDGGGYFNAFKGVHGKMITSGEWDFREYPTLYPRSHKDYNFQLRFFIVLTDRKIAGELLTDKTGAFLYFYPFTGEIKHADTTIIYGGAVDCNVLHASKITDTPTSAHVIIHDLITRNKCFYSDNATGEGVRAFIVNEGDI